MKLLALLLALSVAVGCAFAQQKADKTFHHCTVIGGSGNSPHLFDTSEIYKCDEGTIEIAGQTTEVIEYGYVYRQELGRPSCDRPQLATAADYADVKWCSDPHSWDPNQKRRCGDKPHMCWDGKMGTWDPAWRGYSCVGPAHPDKTGAK